MKQPNEEKITRIMALIAAFLFITAIFVTCNKTAEYRGKPEYSQLNTPESAHETFDAPDIPIDDTTDWTIEEVEWK